MIRDITLGQYYPSNSSVHRLDPRVKLAGTMIFLISIFINNTYTGYLLLIGFFMMVLSVSHIPFKHVVKGLKGIIILLLFTAAINIFVTPGTEVFSIWKLTATREGFYKAGFFGIRLTLMVMGASVMTFTTTPTALTDGLEKSLGFLKRLHIPVHDFAMMIGIALRFIPILSEEADKIIKAQEARGADFSSGGLIGRVKNMVPLLVPLLISAFRRAEELAYALDARCYNGNTNRTKLHPLSYSGNDIRGYIILLIYLLAVICFSVVAGRLGLF